MHKELYEHNIIPSAVIDDKGVIIHHNKSFMKLFGADMGGSTFDSLICDHEDAEEYKHNLEDYLDTDNNEEGGKRQIKAKKIDGECFMANFSTFVFDHKGNKSIGVYVIDITEEVSSKQELQNAYEELRANNEDLKDKEIALREKEEELERKNVELEQANARITAHSEGLTEQLKKEKEYAQQKQVIKILAACFFAGLAFLALETMAMYVLDYGSTLSKDLINSADNRSNLLINLLVGIVSGFVGNQLNTRKPKSR